MVRAEQDRTYWPGHVTGPIRFSFVRVATKVGHRRLLRMHIICVVSGQMQMDVLQVLLEKYLARLVIR
jgi:hypothetical protein